jgi:hypothetical protein
MGKLIVPAYAAIILVIVGIALFDQPELAPQTLSTLPRFDTDRALAHLHNLDELTRQGGGRASGTRGHRDVVAYLATAFRDAGLEIRLDRFDDTFRPNLVNIVAELPGSGSEVVILGAHHDAQGEGPAAVEGMAGMAVLLESARSLRESRVSASLASTARQRTILFVSWDGEVLGCAGSTHFVKNDEDGLTERVRAVISLDSLGWKKGVPVVHSPRYFDPSGDDYVAPDWLVWKVIRSAGRAGISAPLGDRWLSIPYQVATHLVDLGYYSNDRPFVMAGIPGVFISDFSLTRFYPYYGSRRDTLDQIGRAPLERAGGLVTAAVRELADSGAFPGGESEYLMVPSPMGWIRLTADHLRLLAALLLLPGLIAMSGSGNRPRPRVQLAIYAAMSFVFLYGALAIDPIVYTALAGPVFLAAPLLVLRHQGGLYGFWASLVPMIGCAFLFVPMLASGAGHYIRLNGSSLLSLMAIAALAITAGAVHGQALRAAKRCSLMPKA